MTSNVQELTVSDLSRALKRTVEESYSYVRVRGEVSGLKRAASGHLYMALKDENAVLDAVCWRGSAGKLATSPEDGMEVIATGRLTTYPGRSKYQIVIDQIDMAGEGALLKLLEERRKKLAAEGLFDDSAKKDLPFLPEVIGVVTSPTGAVIRDILHRLADRFPRHVLLWPVLVQGDGAAAQIAAAITGFNALKPGSDIPRPDLLIIARGGGSLEDLWSFNEEAVVRAAAASDIPLISAVGHETDTTLIDFASDWRAPTPTAAAEKAVPVRTNLMADIADRSRRLIQAGQRGLTMRKTILDSYARGLPQPRHMLDPASQRLDDVSERLLAALPRLLRDKADALIARAGRLRSPADQLARADRDLGNHAERLHRGVTAHLAARQRDFVRLKAQDRMIAAISGGVRRIQETVNRLESGLEALSYKGTLRRGYAIVRDAEGILVRDPSAPRPDGDLEIEFAADQRLSVQPTQSGISRPKPKRIARKSQDGNANRQQDLF